MERKGRRLVGRGRPVNDSVNDFCSSLSGGQSPRAAANQGPRWVVSRQPLLSGPPKTCKPLGARERGPGAQEEAILPRVACLPLTQPMWPCLRPRDPLPGPQTQERAGASRGAQRLLCPRPSWRAASWVPPPAFVHTAIVASLRTLPAPPTVVPGVGDKGMSQPRPPCFPLQLHSGPREVGLGQESSQGPGWAWRQLISSPESGVWPPPSPPAPGGAVPPITPPAPSPSSAPASGPGGVLAHSHRCLPLPFGGIEGAPSLPHGPGGRGESRGWCPLCPTPFCWPLEKGDDASPHPRAGRRVALQPGSRCSEGLWRGREGPVSVCVSHQEDKGKK